MTDNEIVEALKLCITQDGSIPCYDCPCWNDDEQKCEGIDYTATLDLINRQKAEIKRLQKEVNLVSIQFQDLQERMNDIKAEAYKEFAERLKKEVLSDCGYDILQSGTIDKVLNEMEGDL